MHPAKVRRENVRTLTDLPNIGPALARRLALIGVTSPAQLLGQCPYALFEDLCERTQTREDPCVLDTFISLTRFMAGEPAQAWWAYTTERKLHQQQESAKLWPPNSTSASRS
ncbi:hypothetical protein GCM10027046_03290 [Uliginosibacterium flavum]|uniref:Helix-hairpin-helix domain-containing protein n=1 Tax=Uliginosibacterium flavum TaxID=1396831 RepID=A0ABV2TJJ9_9RHOO